MLNLKWLKRAPMNTDDPVSSFALDDLALLMETYRWAEWAQPMVRQSSAASEADFATLVHALSQIIKSIKDPHRRIGRTVRAEVMDVLRREGMEQYGFDPLSMAQTLRKIAKRAVWVAPVDAPPAKAAQDAEGQTQREMDALRQQIETLQEVIDYLSQTPVVSDKQALAVRPEEDVIV